MSEKTQTEAVSEAPKTGAEDLAEESFAGVASFADAESREILNLLGDTAEGASCCGGSCCS